MTDRPYVLFEDKPARPWRPGGEWSLWHQPTVRDRPERVADKLQRGSALSLQCRLNAAADAVIATTPYPSDCPQSGRADRCCVFSVTRPSCDAAMRMKAAA